MSRSMISDLDDNLLLLLQSRVRGLIGKVQLLDQAKRRERGAWMRP